MAKSNTTAIRGIGVSVKRKALLRRYRGPAKSTPVSGAQRGPPLGMYSAQETAKLADRDRLLLAHLPLVKAIAVGLRAALPVHLELDDLVQAGVLGLIDAASKFDSKQQVIFRSYAKHRIKGAILDSLRKLDWASRDMRQRQKQVEAAEWDLAAILGRAPTEVETAVKLGMDVERYRRMMFDLRNGGTVSASTHAGVDPDLPLPDFPSKTDTHPDSIFAREQLGRVLAEAMKTLSERSRKVVLLYYINELTMKRIGRMLRINESRVSQINKAALQKMAIALHHGRIDSIHAFYGRR
jgi:RNA polymerase sigma factor FliA